MKNIQLLLSFCLIGLFFSFTQADWERYTSYEGKFTILTPGTLTEKSSEIQTEVGLMTYYTFLYQPKEELPENFIYMISYVDYPVETFHQDSVEVTNAFFDTTIEGATESLNGELRYADEISQSNFPGRLWRIDYINGEAVMKSKAFLVGNRYYCIQVATHQIKSSNSNMDKFLESFKIIH